jgi:NAD+ kinase
VGRKIGIIFNDTKLSASKAVHTTSEWLASKGCRIHTATGWGGILGFAKRDSPVCHTPIHGLAPEGFDEDMEFAVVLGGDGTVLSAIRQIAPAGIPLLTVNTGHMGFLTETYLTHLQEAIEAVMEGAYDVEERTMLEVRVYRDERILWEAIGVNEAVVHKEPFTAMCHFEVTIGRHNPVDIAADGLIIATPTGSTAYALSAGGPVITPDVQVMQVIPICPHSLAARALVFADHQPLVVYPPINHEDLILNVDGSSGCYILPGDRIVMERSAHRARLIRLKPPEFFELLREKLGWGLPHIAKPFSVELP